MNEASVFKGWTKGRDHKYSIFMVLYINHNASINQLIQIIISEHKANNDDM